MVQRWQGMRMLEPFLKWPGGKRWFVRKCQHLFPARFNRYIEPFLGSGAVFFSLRPERALLSDINNDLIDTYRAIRDNWSRVFTTLKIHHKNHCKEYYYKVRSSTPKSLHIRAARFIYLNRTCWNGLYRVNLKGEFNVPIGTKKNAILDTDDFAEVSRLLQNTEIEQTKFSTIIDQATEGDLLFADPPYTVKHSNNGFIKYNEELFNWDDQVLLSERLKFAKERGAFIISTNANHKSIRNLYEDHFDLIVVDRNSVIAADPTKRGRYKELVIKG
jgi:DNA adenine methylase